MAPVRDRLRWGVMGATSNVAQEAVMPALEASDTNTIVAVASRSDPAGATLDGRYSEARRYGDYEALLQDDEVQAVYIPLPNSMHHQWSIAAMRAGRHVLCEKPLAPSVAQAQDMERVAQETGRVLMEAYMSPFHPRSEAIEAMVMSGRLGELRFGRSSFTGVLSKPDDHRWQPDIGGGVLLDVGIYCVAPLLALTGDKPRSVAGGARWTQGGVDASFSGWLELGAGSFGVFDCSFEAPERQEFELVGSEASLRVRRAFTPGPDDQTFELTDRKGLTTVVRTPGGNCYKGMVEHFAAVVAGTGVPRRPPSSSVALAQVIERLGDHARSLRGD